MRQRMVLGLIAAVVGWVMWLQSGADPNNPTPLGFLGAALALFGAFFVIEGAVDWARTKDRDDENRPHPEG